MHTRAPPDSVPSYCPVLLRTDARVAVLVAFAVLLAVCSWGASQLSVESSFRSFVPDGSYLLDTLDKDDKYFGDEGANVYIVTRSFDYFADQDKLRAIKDEVAEEGYLQNPYTTDTYDSWYEAFEKYCNSTATCGDYLNVEADFYSDLRAFIASSDGGVYNTSVVFQGYDTIVASRIETQFKSYST